MSTCITSEDDVCVDIVGRVIFICTPLNQIEGFFRCIGGVMTDVQWQRIIDLGLSVFWTDNYGEKTIPDLTSIDKNTLNKRGKSDYFIYLGEE